MRAEEIDWSVVRRVLVVRLRSIGDTVLCTPSLIALKNFLPNTEIDILLERWVSPVLDGFDSVDRVLTVGESLGSRLSTAAEIQRRHYDVVFNLHGGPTATLFAFTSRARYRVGYSHYQFAFLHNRILSSAADFWKRPDTHSAEQQLALLGAFGVPVSDPPKSRLVVTEQAEASLTQKLAELKSRSPDLHAPFALIHPTAATKTKEWPIDNFARTAEFLDSRDIRTVAVAAEDQEPVLDRLVEQTHAPVFAISNLTLPEITALASRATLFVGNDSGIAHIAAATQTPSVVVFGSSSRDHWRPWTEAPNEMVFEEFHCQPCPGRECAEFGEPRCILSITPEKVIGAIDRILSRTDQKKAGSPRLPS